jgi:hypothetical protein
MEITRHRDKYLGWGMMMALLGLPLMGIRADDANGVGIPPEAASRLTNGTHKSFQSVLVQIHQSEEEALLLIDGAHDRISSNIVSYVGRVDRFFGADQVRDENRSNYIQAGVGFKWKKGEGLSFENDVDARLTFPNLEDRLQLAVDTVADRLAVDTVRQVTEAYESPKAETALRYIFVDVLHYRVNLDAGIDTNPFDPFLKLRGNLKLPYSDDLLQLRETVKYSIEDDFLETTTLQWDNRLSPQWVFRSASSVTWADATNGVSPQQVFQLYGRLDETKAVKFELGGYWPAVPHSQEDDYWVSASYRQRVYDDWLFMEVIPKVEFPKPQDYDAVPSVTIMMSALFGEWRDP